MPVCFKCKQNSSNVRALFKHFTTMHSADSFPFYACAEMGCSRKFDTKQSLSRHLRLCHLTPALCIPTSSANPVLWPDDAEPMVEKEEDSDRPSTSNNNFLVRYEGGKELPLFVASLYANKHLPRNTINSIVKSLTSHASLGVTHIVRQCLSQMDASNVIVCNDLDFVLQSISQSLDTSFSNFISEHKSFNYFEKISKTLIKPKEIVIGQRMNLTKRGDSFVTEPITCTQQVISLRHILKNFLSIPGVFHDIIQYMNDLKRSRESGVIQNIIQASSWIKQERVHGDKLVIPLYLFFDDFETGNVLSSHAGIHKLGAVYVSIASLPAKWSSQLCNIFLATIFHSSDRVSFGNSVIFNAIIEELNFLYSSGIDIEVGGIISKCYFQLGAIIGDNLGIHSIIGFSESFSANHPCRICSVSKDILKKQCFEDESALRNSDEYNEQINSKLPLSATGIKEKCVWLNLQGFNLFDHVCVDFLHDFLEGVAKYVLSFLIVRYVSDKFFLLEVLNDRIASFNFGPDRGSKPTVLSMDHLKQGNVRLTASEMIIFVRYFPLLVGDFIPTNEPSWDLVKSLRKVMDILLCRYFTSYLCENLQVYVGELNEQFLLFSQQSLKPKFHFLTHYHRIISKLGPPITQWSMRYEGKHRVFKDFSKSTCNRKNICLTLALRHQLQLNYMFLIGHLQPVLEFGPEIKIKRTCLDGIDCSGGFKSFVWVKFSRIQYCKGSVLLFDIPEDDDPIFMQINNIYVLNRNNIIIFKCFKYSTIGFDEHFLSYEVSIPEKQEFLLKSLNDISPTIHHFTHAPNGNDYVTCRDYV